MSGVIPGAMLKLLSSTDTPRIEAPDASEGSQAPEAPKHTYTYTRTRTQAPQVPLA